MVNYKRVEKLIAEIEFRERYGIPFRPSDASKRAHMNPSAVENNDEGLQDDLAEIKRLIAAGEYEKARLFIKRLGERFTVPARLPRRERPLCGAKTRSGTPCMARVVWLKGEPLPRKRCRMHGGLSTGPVTETGKQAIAESNRRRKGVDQSHHEVSSHHEGTD